MEFDAKNPYKHMAVLLTMAMVFILCYFSNSPVVYHVGGVLFLILSLGELVMVIMALQKPKEPTKNKIILYD